MTTKVEYRCPQCQCLFTSEVRADRLDACRNGGCPGQPRRNWRAVNLNRENLRAVPRG